MSFGQLLTIYQSAYLDPIPSSIIALAVRISPSTTSEEFLSTLLASVSKELTASINRYQGAIFNYQCIFSPDLTSREIPFSNRMAPNPEVASDTYQIFCQLRHTLSNQIVFPSIGSKTVGSKVADNFWEAYTAAGCTFKHAGQFDSEFHVTTKDCLKLYEQTGGYVDGPVEVRSSWKYAQIDPRIYYARGGSVVPASQYLQPIVNVIIDAFPETHRLNRFSAPQTPLDRTDVEIIYDYSSFTSSLDEIVEFVRHLAHFFRGTLITIIDVLEGPMQMDLGDMLDRYNEECNDYIKFDPTRVTQYWTEDLHPLTHTCGMLGVEGNIFLATLLHGLHLRFLAGLKRSRCVGDDARFHYDTGTGRLPPDERTVVSWILAGLAPINYDKLGLFEEGIEPELQAYRYVKRPIKRDSDIMVEGLMIDIPSLIPLFELADKHHTVFPSSTHPCRQAFKSIIRLLRVLKLHSITLENDREGISMIACHVQFLLNEIRRLDPACTHSPFGKSDIQTNYRLPSVKDWGRIDYAEWVLYGLSYDTEVRFLKMGGASEDGGCDGRIGSTMIRETNGRRSFLLKMGYLLKEDMYDQISISMVGTDVMREYLEGQYRAVCRYEVVEEIPPWYSHIPCTL